MKRILIIGVVGFGLLIVACMMLGIIGVLVSPSKQNIKAASLPNVTVMGGCYGMSM